MKESSQVQFNNRKYLSDSLDIEEVGNMYSHVHDGSQPFSYEPARDQEQTGLSRSSSQQ